MSKFGALIDQEIPVLLDFYTEMSQQTRAMNATLRDVAVALGDRAKVIKIDIDKNQELAEALRIKSAPTLMIYKNGEMKWRQSGVQDVNSIISAIEAHI